MAFYTCKDSAIYNEISQQLRSVITNGQDGRIYTSKTTLFTDSPSTGSKKRPIIIKKIISLRYAK